MFQWLMLQVIPWMVPLMLVICHCRSTISSDGRYGYVTNQNSDNISKIDLFHNNVVSIISVGDRPVCMALNSTGTRLYVSNNQGDSVSVVNLENSTSSEMLLNPPFPPLGLEFSNDTLYVAGKDGNISVFSTSINPPAPIPPIEFGIKSYDLVMLNNRYLYVSSSKSPYGDNGFLPGIIMYLLH